MFTSVHRSSNTLGHILTKSGEPQPRLITSKLLRSSQRDFGPILTTWLDRFNQILTLSHDELHRRLCKGAVRKILQLVEEGARSASNQFMTKGLQDCNPGSAKQVCVLQHYCLPCGFNPHLGTFYGGVARYRARHDYAGVLERNFTAVLKLILLALTLYDEEVERLRGRRASWVRVRSLDGILHPRLPPPPGDGLLGLRTVTSCGPSRPTLTL